MSTYIHGTAQTCFGIMFITGLLINHDQEANRPQFKVLGVSNPEFEWQIGRTFEYTLLSWDFYTM